MSTNTTPVVVSRTVTVGSGVGLHARPAALVAEAAGAQPVAVHLSTGGDPVDARSLLSILALGATHGDEVVVSASGDGAEAAVAAVADVIASDHDADG